MNKFISQVIIANRIRIHIYTIVGDQLDKQALNQKLHSDFQTQISDQICHQVRIQVFYKIMNQIDESNNGNLH
jgi:hypothetical protein